MAVDMEPEEMEEWRTIFNLFDVDGDESITCEEFVILMKKKTEDAEGNDDIEEAFRIFDSNNDGVICAEELMSVMICLGNPRTMEEIKEMIAEEDPDGDGIVTKEEFTKMLERKK